MGTHRWGARAYAEQINGSISTGEFIVSTLLLISPCICLKATLSTWSQSQQFWIICVSIYLSRMEIEKRKEGGGKERNEGT